MVFFDGIICFLKRPEIGPKICFFVTPGLNGVTTSVYYLLSPTAPLKHNEYGILNSQV